MEEIVYMTVDETAAYLRMPIVTTYKLMKKKGFPAVKLGKQWRVNKHALDLWFLKQHDRIKITG